MKNKIIYLIVGIVSLAMIIIGVYLWQTRNTAKTAPTKDTTAEPATTSNESATAQPAESSATAHSIGENYGGGIVFYVDSNGQHGLIAAKTDQGTGTAWYGGRYTTTSARATEVGTGSKNTTMIISSQGPAKSTPYAASVCDNYSVTVDGITYDDWYLPSKEELNLLYAQRTVVGGFTKNFYWSSTETNSKYALGLYFLNGDQFPHDKSGSNYSHVRAIRSF